MAGTQWHASAQLKTLTLTGEYHPSAQQSLRDTQLSLDNSGRTAERLHFSRSSTAEVKLLKWLLSLREQMLGYPLRRTDLMPTEVRLSQNNIQGTGGRAQAGSERHTEVCEKLYVCIHILSIQLTFLSRVTHKRNFSESFNS